MTRLLEIDHSAFSEDFARRPFTVEHVAHRASAAVGRVDRAAGRAHPGGAASSTTAATCPRCSRAATPRGGPHSGRDRPRHRDERLLDGPEAHRAGPAVQAPPGRAARRGRATRVRPRGRAPAGGLRSSSRPPNSATPVPYRSGAQLPASGRGLEGDARRLLQRPAGGAANRSSATTAAATATSTGSPRRLRTPGSTRETGCTSRSRALFRRNGDGVSVRLDHLVHPADRARTHACTR